MTITITWWWALPLVMFAGGFFCGHMWAIIRSL